MRAVYPFRTVHVSALALCAVLVPWSTALLSMAQMLLAANWLAEGVARRDLAGRFRRALTSAPVLVFTSFFALHVLGLLWTEDLAWGASLSRILVPVVVFAVILGGSPPLSGRELRIVLLIGAWSAVACTLFGLVMAGGAPDYRALSRFISHIRLAMLLAFAVVVFLHYRSGPWWRVAAQVLAAGWAVLFISKLGSLQAMAMLAVIGVVLLWRWASRLPAAPRLALRTALVLLPSVFAAWMAVEVVGRFRMSDQAPLEREEFTAGGERYTYAPSDPQTENGMRVWDHVAWGELHRAWERRSTLPIDSPDAQGHVVKGTLARYLTSLGLRKDSVGMMGLSEEDVRRIERGVPSAFAGRRSGLRERFDEVLLEVEHYRATGDANGHSVTMRLEHLRAGWAIARAHWASGVGTGDTQRAFDAQYERMDSTLLPPWRYRAHNQYLTLWISFGVLGLLWSLFTWWWPAWKLGAWRDPLFIAWAIIFGISCLTDDTIETQAGATFLALYYALLVFAAPRPGTLAGIPQADGAPGPAP